MSKITKFVSALKQRATDLMNTIYIKTQMAKDDMKAAMSNHKMALATERKGAVAFEYIIILVFMVVVIVAAWNILQPVVLAKVNEIRDAVGNANPSSGVRR